MDELEIWKPVIGYEGLYEVSSFGRVRSLDDTAVSVYGRKVYQHIRKGRILSPTQNYRSGYMSVMFRDHKRRYVHRLVAETFLPKIPGANQVNHKDEDKTNNRRDNLERCTRKYNINYGTGKHRQYLAAKKNKRGSYPKSIAQYTSTGEFVALFDSSQEAARKIGIPWGGTNIRKCARGEQLHAHGFRWVYTDEPMPFLE